MIHPFKISLVQAAKRAPPRVLVQDLRFGKYAGDKDHIKIWSTEDSITSLLDSVGKLKFFT